jgi:aminotransferase
MADLKPMSVSASELPVSGIRRFFDVAAQMQDVISLGVGEPDFLTPWNIREAAIYSLERGQTTYTSNHGLLELRREIAKHIKRLYQVSYKPEDEVLVTVGVSEGLDLAMRTLLDPGDEVLVPEPCYVSYKPCVSLAGGRPVGVETTAAEKFRVSVAALEKHLTPRTKAILLGYPSNPTGATMPLAQMEEVVQFAAKRGLYLVSDEIYDRLTYEGVHTCVSAIKGARERTILLNGFSKAYAMTGWRVAYVCAPSEIVSVMTRIHSYTILCAPTIGQKAALEALKSGESEVVDMVTQYGQRRRLIVDGLNAIGLKCRMPDGAFYAFPSIESTGLTSEEFAEKLLYQERVAVVPGTAFGAGGAGHVRCSYATAIDKIEMALQRMKTFVDSLAVKESGL